MPKTTKANKGKGRTFQQWGVKWFNNLFPEGDFTSLPMGQAGSDMVDPHHILPWQYTEFKHWRYYPTLTELESIITTKKQGSPPRDVVCIVKGNYKPPLVVMPLCVLERLLEEK